MLGKKFCKMKEHELLLQAELKDMVRREGRLGMLSKDMAGGATQPGKG